MRRKGSTLGATISLTFLAFIKNLGCRSLQQHSAQLLDENEVIVPIKDGKIMLQGFIAGGNFELTESKANESAINACNNVNWTLFDILDRSRLALSNDIGQKCGERSNENPFQYSGFLFAYHPSFTYAVDPGDIVVERSGSELKGEIGPNHYLSNAFGSFNSVCFKEIKSAKAKWGTAFLAATCGDVQIHTTWVSSPGHAGKVPNIQLTSKTRIFIRKVVHSQTPQTKTLKASYSVSIPFDATSISSVGPNSAEVIISTLIGTVSRIDLRTGLKLWEKNLTSPNVKTLRETTSINTSSASSDGKWIAVGGDYGYLVLLNGTTGSKIKVLSCDPQMFLPIHFQSLAFSSDQRSLVSGAVMQPYPIAKAGYNNIKFPNDRETYKVKITKWDTQTFSEQWSTELNAGNILQVGFNKIQNFVVVAASNKIILLSAMDGKTVREFPLSDYEGPLKGSFISGAAFSDDMRLLAISSFSGVTVINTETTKVAQKLRANLNFELGQPEFITSSNQIRAFDAWGNVFQWDVLTGELTEVATAPNLNIQSGPATMPILSLFQGKFLVHTQWNQQGGPIDTPEPQPSANYQNICRAGEGTDLSDLQFHHSARIVVWSSPD